LITSQAWRYCESPTDVGCMVQAPLCYNGVVSEDGKVCCALACGTCSNLPPNANANANAAHFDSGCSHRGPPDVCCVKNIVQRGRTCKHTYGQEAEGTTGCLLPASA
jgi:hypothetical protein